MNFETPDEIEPGRYRFRPNPFEPWQEVHIFNDSSSPKTLLKARWDGVEIDAAKIINRGEWKAV